MSVNAQRPTAASLPGPPLGNKDPGREAWALMVRLMQSNKPRMAAIASDFDLSPMQVHALLALGDEGEVPMSALAERLVCDASNVTGIVDRLEGRGLIERRGAPNDRRVKMLVLTEEGRANRAQVGRQMSEPPPAVAELSVDDKRALRDVLRRALGI